MVGWMQIRQEFVLAKDFGKRVNAKTRRLVKTLLPKRLELHGL